MGWFVTVMLTPIPAGEAPLCAGALDLELTATVEGRAGVIRGSGAAVDGGFTDRASGRSHIAAGATAVVVRGESASPA